MSYESCGRSLIVVVALRVEVVVSTRRKRNECGCGRRTRDGKKLTATVGTLYKRKPKTRDNG